MGANQTIRIDVIARASTGQLRKAQQEIRSLGAAAKTASTQAVGGMSVLGRASQAAGTALIAGVGVGLALSAKAAIDFESAFAGVRKTVDASESQFDMLKTTLQDLSLDIPVNVNELAKIAELGGQLGVSVGGLEKFTEVIAKLAVTTNLEIDEAATSMARFANIMGTSEGDFDRIASAVVDLGNNFATTEAEIFTFGTRLAGIAVTVGASEADVLGLAAAFTSLGEPAERGATAVQRSLVAMFSAIDTGGPKLEMFAEVVGVTADEFARMFQEDSFDTFVQFEKGLKLIIDSGGDVTSILKSLGLGSQRTLGLLLKGAAGWEILDDGISGATDAYIENIAADEEAAKRFETTASQIQLLANSFQVLAINIGEKTLGPIREIVERMRAFVEVFSEAEAVTGKFFIAIAALLAARVLVRMGTGLSKLLLLTGDLVNSDKIFFGGMRLGTMFGRMGTLVKFAGGWLGVLAAAFGLYLAVTANARAKTNKLIESIERLNEVLANPDATSKERMEAFEQGLFDATETSKASFFSQIADNETGKANLRETKTILRDYKVAWSTFVDAALAGGDEFNALEDQLLGPGSALDDIASLRAEALTRGAGEPAPTRGGKSISELQREFTLVTELFAKTRQAFQISKDLTSEARREARLANPLSLEEQIAVFKAANATVEAIVEDTPETTLLDSISNFIGDDADGKKAIALLDDFNDVIMEFGTDFQDTWNDVISDFADNLTGWEAIWGGYEAVVAPSVAKITASIEAFREDNRRVLAAQGLVMSQFSFDYRVFWLSLEDEQQRGLAALLADDGIGAFTGLLTDMFNEGIEQSKDVLEAGTQVLGTVVLDTIRKDWPPKLRKAMAIAEAGGFDPGTEGWKTAMGDALEEMLAEIALKEPALAKELQDLMEVGAQSGILFDEDLFASAMDILTSNMSSSERVMEFWRMGFSWAQAIELGFAAADIPAATANEVRRATNAIREAAKKGLVIDSPSKLFKGYGEMVSAGFNQGLNGFGNTMTSLMDAVPRSSMVNQTANRTVQVFMEPTGDTADQIQLGLMMSGVTERIEWAGSTSFSGRK